MSDAELLSKLRAKKQLQSLCRVMMHICSIGSVISLVLILAVAVKKLPWVIPVLVLVLMLVITFFMWLVVTKIDKELEVELGTGFIKKILGEKVELYDYEPFKTIDYRMLKRSRLFGLFDKADGSDYFRAVYNGVTFEYCDALLTSHNINSGNGAAAVTEFEGGVIMIDMESPISGTVLVKEKKESSENVENLVRGIDISKMKPVESGNQEFDAKFLTETRVEGEEKAILNPLFTGRMCLLSEEVAERLLISVQKDHITVAISKSEDRFDIPPVHKMKDAEKFKEIYRKQLREILDIVNVFIGVTIHS